MFGALRTILSPACQTRGTGRHITLNSRSARFDSNSCRSNAGPDRITCAAAVPTVVGARGTSLSYVRQLPHFAFELCLPKIVDYSLTQESGFRKASCQPRSRCCTCTRSILGLHFSLMLFPPSLLQSPYPYCSTHSVSPIYDWPRFQKVPLICASTGASSSSSSSSSSIFRLNSPSSFQERGAASGSPDHHSPAAPPLHCLT